MHLPQTTNPKVQSQSGSRAEAIRLWVDLRVIIAIGILLCPSCGRTYLGVPGHTGGASSGGGVAFTGLSEDARSGAGSNAAGAPSSGTSGGYGPRSAGTLVSGGRPASGGASLPTSSAKGGGAMPTSQAGGAGGTAPKSDGTGAGGFQIAQPAYGLTDILPYFKPSKACTECVEKHCPAAMVCSQDPACARELSCLVDQCTRAAAARQPEPGFIPDDANNCLVDLKVECEAAGAEAQECLGWTCVASSIPATMAGLDVIFDCLHPYCLPYCQD